MKNRIKELRKSLKLNQNEFGERLGVSGALVCNWERGDVEVPPARVFQICAVYGVSRDWLEEGEGAPTTDAPKESIEAAARRVAIFYAAELLERLPDDLQKNIVEVLRGIVAAKDRRADPPTGTESSKDPSR